MKCLVTGGAGFIGSNLTDKLIEDGHEVVIIDDLSTGNKDNLNSKASWNQFDIGNEASVPYMIKIMRGVDVVFHFAAKARVQPSIDDPISFNKTNVDGTLNLLKGAVDHGIKNFMVLHQVYL